MKKNNLNIEFNSKHFLADKRILLASYTWKDDKGNHSHLGGPPQDLYRYLSKNAKEVVFLEQPQSYCPDITPLLTRTSHGVEEPSISFPMWWFPLHNTQPDIQQKPLSYALFKLRDIFSMLYFTILLHKKFDIFIGVESINATFGVMLRSIGLVDKVVYDVIDYSDQRFSNKILNKIFHILDRFCCYRSDFSWIQTHLVSSMRIQLGADKNKICTEIIKPSGFGEDESSLHKESITNYSYGHLVYVGSLHQDDGVDKLIEAMPLILANNNNVKLTIIGGGSLENELKQKVKELSIDSIVDFLGFIGDPVKVESILSSASIGIAPYRDNKTSVKRFNDPSKPKLYLGCSLPVIITDVPHIAKEIEKSNAGILVQWDSNDIAKNINYLLDNPEILLQYKKNAIKMATKYTWNALFNDLFRKMLLSPE